MADYGVNIAIKFSETKLNKLTDKLNRASKSANKINEAFKKVQQKGGASLNKTNGTLDKKLTRLKNINKELQRENKLLTENASLQRQATRSGRGGGGRPGGGFGGFGGGGRLGQAVLGGGFPLLFGGSPFQAAAGAVGGAFGGFAGGIGLQVVAGQIENLVGRTAEVGQAFNELSFDLDTVASATGIAGTETQSFLEKIERYGSKAKAAELATKLLASRVGQDGVNALTSFGENAVTLGNNLSTIFTQVLANIAKVAGPILEFLSKAAGDQAAKQAFDKATGLTGVELAAQKFRAGSMRGQDIKNFAKNLRAAGFEGTLPTSGIQARKISDQIAIARGKARMAIPELEIAEFAKTVQTPEDKKKTPLQKQEELATKMLQKAKERSRLAEAMTAQEKRSLRLIIDKEAVERDLNLLAPERKQAIIDELENQFMILNIVDERKKQDKALADAAKERQAAEKKAADNLAAIYRDIGTSIKAGVVDAISSAVEGTKTLGEVAGNVLRSISNRLLDVAVALGLNALFPGSKLFPNPITGKANGGSVGSGRPYLVGERGPELFVPGAQGNIVPNNAMGGASIVVNVDASGTEVQGNQGNADQLGRLIGQAVQAELIKQKRPGGLLTR